MVSDIKDEEGSLAVYIDGESSIVESPSATGGSLGPEKLTGESIGKLAPPSFLGVECRGEFSFGSELFGSKV